MKGLKKQLQNNEYHNIYLFYGEEKYLLDMYLNKLIDGLLADTDKTMNYDYFDKSSMNIDKFFNTIETLPFFASRRVIVVSYAKLCKGKSSNSTTIAERITDIPESTTVIFLEEDIDKRSKLYKVINKNGYAVNFSKLSENDLVKWIAQKFHTFGKKIERSTAIHFLKVVGTDMTNIDNEIEKLAMFCMDEDIITKDSIDEICTRSIENKIFELVSAMGQNRRERAVLLYHDMITAKEPPGRILFMLIRQFRLILQSKLLQKKGLSEREIGSRIKLAPFIVRECLRQGKNMSIDHLKQALNDCLETDSGIKIGKIDAKIGVEVIIMKYS
ncbi:DNA polymerase III subunit delta [Vallitalea longa]|uniref:DNA polymerase III subunit delta n=1 Tax=Vallitalea longa TaxID=2936439 RepID=A0A9W5YH90_9FIRM|nr:DNA polymerase III subunit delta [Vallitalea longa]GKX31138.1 DNA polymerase III subunit delta [Vallitalea longa]